MLRVFFIGLAAAACMAGLFVEAGQMAHAQAVPSPLLIVATVPPPPTPLPKLVLPRELFAEAQDNPDVTTGTDAVASSATVLANTALAGDGVISVSVDNADARNSEALISTPHGTDIRRVQDTENGLQILGITQRGVVFQGGLFLPIGYSQQGAGLSVPPIGVSMPARTVPVNVNMPTPLPAATPYAAPTVTRINGVTTAIPTPHAVSPFNVPQGPQGITPFNTTGTPGP